MKYNESILSGNKPFFEDWVIAGLAHRCLRSRDTFEVNEVVGYLYRARSFSTYERLLVILSGDAFPDS